MTELDWWEGAELGGVRFDFVPAHHWSKRTLTDACRTLWGGWVLTGASGQRLYFAGDTGYGHCFAEIGRRHPGIDIALLPAFRGRGIGSALITGLFAEADGALLPVRIHVEHANPAQRLYQRLGFAFAGEAGGVYRLMERPPRASARVA